MDIQTVCRVTCDACRSVMPGKTFITFSEAKRAAFLAGWQVSTDVDSNRVAIGNRFRCPRCRHLST